LKQSRRILHHVFVFVGSSTGPTVRVRPNHLTTSDPDLVKKTNAVRSTYTRGRFYEGAHFHSTENNMLSILSETVHTRLRTQLAPGVSSSTCVYEDHLMISEVLWKENPYLEEGVDESHKANSTHPTKIPIN
jgi:hypothetical protein